MLTLVTSKPHLDPLGELYYGKPIRRHVREFGCVIALVLLLLAGLKLYRHGVGLTPLILTGVAVAFVGLCYAAPSAMRPAWSAWMKFAEKLGSVMNVVILTLAWTIALVPIALTVRFFRAKVMDLSFRQPVQSYWETRDSKYDDFKLLNRQF